jgi:predicted O-methyltransferase YrrM
VNEIAQEIYAAGRVVDADGNEYPLDSHVDANEGRVLFELIRSDPSIVRTVEIGCAYGLSSLHICEALTGRDGASHTIVDPNQFTDWHGIGAYNLDRMGVDFYRVVSEPSELALPELVRTGRAGFDLVFIDGWHTFDHTLIDMFFADQLVRIGGYVVVDDCDRITVGKAVSYFENYPNYEVVREPGLSASSTRAGRLARALLPMRIARRMLPVASYDRQYLSRLYPSMVALRKIAEDERDWRWYETF